MKMMRLQSALALSVAGALALVGCSSDEGEDSGTTPRDGGVVADTGIVETDSGVPAAGRPDMGRPDTGPVGICPPNTLGCDCTPDAMGGPGTCASPDHACVQWSAEDEPLLATCVKPCDFAMNGDTECANEFTAGRMNRPANVCRGLCVEQEVADGQDCNRGAVRGERLSGCAAGSLCITGINETAYIGSCGRPCADNGDCAAPNPVCNPNILSSTVTPGICSARRLGAGSICRPADITGQCDSTNTFPFGTPVQNVPSLNCFSIFFGTEPLGHCYEISATTVPEATRCSASSDNVLERECMTGLFQNPAICLCSDNCEGFPNNCPGMGSESNGQNCTGDIQFNGRPEDEFYSWCLDVISPVIPEWDWATNPQPCDQAESDAYRCERGTLCLAVQQGVTACVRACDATATGTAAVTCTGATRTATVCTSLGIEGLEEAGVCTPPQ